MSKANEPAFPVAVSWSEDNPEILVPSEKSLTKKEYYIGQAIRGLLSNPNIKIGSRTLETEVQLIVETAFEIASETIAQLEKTEK